MCGIIGYNGSQDPKGILLDGLKRLEYRGYDSAGIAIMTGNNTEVFRSEGRLQNLEKKMTDLHFQGSMGVGHTRWATHGAPTELNAHPHRAGSITLVHNGIIENYMEHKQALLKLGRKIVTDTDSEILAHLFDIEIQSGKTLSQAVVNILPRLKGSYAFVLLSEHEPEVVVGVCNGAPLVVGLGKKENFLASDVQALLHRTNRIIYLKDQQFAVCRKEGVEVRRMDGTPVEVEVKTLHWTPDQMEKAGYAHYMLKEIHEQGQAIANTIESNIDHRKGIVSLHELTSFLPKLEKLKRISIVACGTARHAALIGKYYIERFARVPVDVDFGSEFRYRDPILEENSLAVLISQSGETADTLAGLREAKKKNTPALSICNVRESTLTRESDVVLYTNAGPEIGVASTKAFTTQLTSLYMFAVQLGVLKGHLSQSQAQELTSDLLSLPILVEKTLRLEPQIQEIAADLQATNFFFYMGRDVNYPIALEGALKLKEISYAHAEGHPAGELKHGPIALIDRNAAVIVLAPMCAGLSGDVIHEKILSNLQQVKSRGGSILTIGSEGDQKFRGESRYFVGVPKATWGLNPVLLSLPMQLLAYHIAVQRGTDVDKPRNLAKSVTVE